MTVHENNRDLAARNLLVDDSYRVRVADFGFSRLKESQHTHAYTEKVSMNTITILSML